MKKIIVLVIAFAAFTGCATTNTANEARLETRLTQLEHENAAFRRHYAEELKAEQARQTGKADGGAAKQDAQAPKQADPSIDPNQQVITVSNVTTFAQANPGAFQCFMDRNPGFGGEWVEVMNYTHKYWLSAKINSQPVIVLRPVPGGWQPYYAKANVTVLPPGKACYAWMPQGRMKPDGDLQSYRIEADAYFPSFQDGWHVLLSESRTSYFPFDSTGSANAEFTLLPNGITWYALKDYMFK